MLSFKLHNSSFPPKFHFSLVPVAEFCVKQKMEKVKKNAVIQYPPLGTTHHPEQGEQEKNLYVELIIPTQFSVLPPDIIINFT